MLGQKITRGALCFYLQFNFAANEALVVHEVGFERSYAVEIINFKIADIGDGAKDIPNMAHLHSPSVVSRL